MAELTAAQIEWSKVFFGFDVTAGGPAAAPSGEQAKKPSEQAKEPGADGEGESPKGVIDWIKEKLGLKKPDEPPPPLPSTEDLAKKVKALNDEIGKVQKAGFDTARMVSDSNDLCRQMTKAEKEQDTTKRSEAIAALGQRADDLMEHVKSLQKSLKDVMGESKDAPSKDQKSQVYKKALEQQYGLTIEVPEGMTNTHFDRMFDMFGTVPKSDTKQDKLKKLMYDDSAGWKDGGSYNKSLARVRMGDFGDATKNATGNDAYTLNGETQEPNLFDITALHEIGHSVDAKNSIMSANQGKDGCGKWASETVDTVTTAMVAELKATVSGISTTTTDDGLKEAVKTALSAGTTTQPGSITSNDDWQKILPFLISHCLPGREAAGPYYKPGFVAIGSDKRVYVDAGSGEWWSYSADARGKTLVNNYQWRSPAEWFAEVYAISWFKKNKPPSGVDPAVAKFCWTG